MILSYFKAKKLFSKNKSGAFPSLSHPRLLDENPGFLAVVAFHTLSSLIHSKFDSWKVFVSSEPWTQMKEIIKNIK